jgi:TonB family protein
LSPEQVRGVVVAKLLDFQGCYAAERARHPDLKGGISIHFTVAADGSVEDAQVISSSLGNAAVESCMLDVFRKLVFPSADLRTRAVFPFVFRG